MSIQSVLRSEPFESPKRGWWAAYTKHHHEKVIARQLTEKGIETFLPLYQAARQWKERSAVVALPLFPGYIFVRGELQSRLGILSTPGVFGIVGTSSAYSEISDIEVQALRRVVEGPRGVQPHPFLDLGQRVRIVRGPLEGVEGVLVRRKNECRMVISVQMLTQAASVEVSEWELAPILAVPNSPAVYNRACHSLA